MKKYDIIVAGGGISGTAAAISAARLGKKVLIIEKTNALGGAANVNLVNPFMPYHTKVNDEIVELSAGIFKEIVEELHKMNGFLTKRKIVDNLAFNEETLKIVLNRMYLKAGGEILFHAYLSDVEMEGETVKSITVATKSGNLKFEADIFIDATGDADIAYMAGCPTQHGREDGLCQPMTLCFRIGNVDTETFWNIKSEINELYKKLQAEGKIKNPRENVLTFKNTTPGVVHFNTTRIVKHDPVDVFDLTKAEIEAREQVYEMYDFLRENFECFKDSVVLSTALNIGVRESRMIVGEYVLNQDDLLACRRFDDSIALANYDIDIHSPDGSGTSHHYFGPGEYYTIPYRCLLPKKANNLIVAGRCISATHEAQASIRVMPIVCCIGEAAGVASALAVESKVAPKDIDVKKLREILAENGAAI